MFEFDCRPEYVDRDIATSRGRKKLWMSPYRANGATLVISQQHFLDVGEENWDFADWKVALKALNEWHPDKQDEPDRWVRNARTGRYRPGGQTCKEYIKWQGTSEEQVDHALEVSLPGHTLLDKKEYSHLVEEPFPKGATCFACTLRPQDCTCGFCLVACCVFHYLDRCIIIYLQEMIMDTVTIEQAASQLLHGLNGEAL